MVIMKTCCYFKNVWNGSFASGIYTMIYFAFSSLILLIYVIDEWDYLTGRREKPKGETVMEKGDLTETHVIFNIIVLISSLGLVASSILMLYGLRKNKRALLLPWILLMLGDVCVELFYAVHFICSRRANFDPIVGFIFTIDLFIVCLNTYCLLCVISQYQAYKEFLHHTNQQMNFAVPIDTSSNNFDETVGSTESPHSIKSSQLQQTPKLVLSTYQHCSPISPIPEERVSETHL